MCVLLQYFVDKRIFHSHKSTSFVGLRFAYCPANLCLQIFMEVCIRKRIFAWPTAGGASLINNTWAIKLAGYALDSVHTLCS